jgi:RimJ/RimL family protein N-acetyltransferase
MKFLMFFPLLLLSLYVLEALATWARSKDIKELVLDVYTENITAIRAYERAGFVNILTAMRRPV